MLRYYRTPWEILVVLRQEVSQNTTVDCSLTLGHGKLGKHFQKILVMVWSEVAMGSTHSCNIGMAMFVIVPGAGSGGDWHCVESS